MVSKQKKAKQKIFSNLLFIFHLKQEYYKIFHKLSTNQMKAENKLKQTTNLGMVDNLQRMEGKALNVRLEWQKADGVTRIITWLIMMKKKK